MKVGDVYIDFKRWDDFRVVKAVNRAGKYKCDIEILLNSDYINVKSVTNMMSLFEEKKPADYFKLCIDGVDEEDAFADMYKYLND